MINLSSRGLNLGVKEVICFQASSYSAAAEAARGSCSLWPCRCGGGLCRPLGGSCCDSGSCLCRAEDCKHTQRHCCPGHQLLSSQHELPSDTRTAQPAHTWELAEQRQAAISSTARRARISSAARRARWLSLA